MKHNYRTCDVCGEKIIPWGECGFIVPKFITLKSFGFNKFDDVDICERCWRKFVAYVKENGTK